MGGGGDFKVRSKKRLVSYGSSTCFVTSYASFFSFSSRFVLIVLLDVLDQDGF